MDEHVRVLVLGGTAEARRLCSRMARDERLEVTVSLAGSTRTPHPYDVSVRIGGFGGASGLADYLMSGSIDILVDATHPFATAISANAALASRTAGVSLAIYRRPPWTREYGLNWKAFPDVEAAIEALAPGARVLVALGRSMLKKPGTEQLASRPDCRFMLRVFDQSAPGPVPANCRLILSRPPWSVPKERALINALQIDCLLCRNSGGEHGMAKLEACRKAAISIHMVERPPTDTSLGNATTFESLEDLEAWIQSAASRSK